jgi:hypothetical protein
MLMVRIEESNPGRRDGGYARLFNDADIGALVSRIHATSIRAGTELEHIISRVSSANGTAIDDLDEFLSNGVDGVFIASKSVIKKSSRIQFSSAEPDYLVFVRGGAKRLCFVVELKDGDQFDTKKSSGEVSNLTAFSTNVGSTLPYSTTVKVCSFNQNDKQAIVTGFKRTIDESMVWTGREFCELMGFDYDAIVNERKTNAEDNKRFLAEQLLLIPDMRQIIEQKIGES